MKELLKADDVSRRQFVNCAAQTLFGVTARGHATGLRDSGCTSCSDRTGHLQKLYLPLHEWITTTILLTLSLAHLKVVLFKAFAPKLTM